jgi:hypothetical protein
MVHISQFFGIRLVNRSALKKKEFIDMLQAMPGDLIEVRPYLDLDSRGNITKMSFDVTPLNPGNAPGWTTGKPFNQVGEKGVLERPQ